MSEKLTITLTGRPPVRITTANWGILASVHRYEGEHDYQSNRHWRLTVRENEAEDRIIVYGSYDTAWRTEHGRRRGVMVDQDPQGESREEAIEAIYLVAKQMEFDEAIAEECIADLAAVEV